MSCRNHLLVEDNSYCVATKSERVKILAFREEKEVHDSLQRRRIIHQRSTPYTADQNGWAERDVKIVIQAGRFMMKFNC